MVVRGLARRRPVHTERDVTLVSPLEVGALGILGIFAGWLGAVIGIGGGVVIVPALVLAFGYDVRVAVAASLVTVIATSTAAGSAYVGRGLTNMRLGMTLEIATTLGGLTGGLIAVLVSPSLISGLFAAMMLLTAFLVVRSREARPPAREQPASSGESGYETRGALAGAYADPRSGALIEYRAERLLLGWPISFLAGIVSGLLGVGGGFLKVPAMTLGMQVPIKVAAATSNFMIGVTAVSSLFVYFARGYVHPFVAAPVALGVGIGALAGTRTAAWVSPVVLRWILAAVLALVGVQMGLQALGVRIG